jgi:hypothetical protein
MREKGMGNQQHPVIMSWQYSERRFLYSQLKHWKKMNLGFYLIPYTKVNVMNCDAFRRKYRKHISRKIKNTWPGHKSTNYKLTHCRLKMMCILSKAISDKLHHLLYELLKHFSRQTTYMHTHKNNGISFLSVPIIAITM